MRYLEILCVSIVLNDIIIRPSLSIQTKQSHCNSNQKVVCLFVCFFVCLFRGFSPTRGFFTHMETSPLPVKAANFDICSALMAIEQ